MTGARAAMVIAITNPGGIENDTYVSLEDFAHHAESVAEGLRILGYNVQGPGDSYRWSAEELAEKTRGFLASGRGGDVQVIHLLTHGEAKLGGLFPVGADALTHRLANVDEWIRGVEHDAPESPVTLFVLDMCGSGVAARTQWSLEIDSELRHAWVMAAAAPHAAAYNARLSSAFAQALGVIARGDLDIHQDVEWVSWAEIRKVVKRHFRAIPNLPPQTLHSTLIEADDEVKVELFRNRNYVPPGPVAIARRDADAGLAAMLDPFEAMDGDHFIERASGRRSSKVMSGAFSGRESVLNELCDWLEQPTHWDPVRVITGRPGSGKSALLGVVVCASHPGLRRQTESIWSRAKPAPFERASVAGVHARGLTTIEVMQSIARQLDLTRATTEGIVSPGLLARAIDDDGSSPLIVIDALDEAQSPLELMEVIADLGNYRSTQGAAVCRILVGTRSGAVWAEIQQWLETLRGGAVIQLDDIPIEELQVDLTTYIKTLLGSGDSGPSTNFSARVAAQLVDHSGEDPEWGAFLVASIFCQMIIEREFTWTPEQEALTVATVPRTLPDVLNMDLATGGLEELRREVLTCLTWSYGEGMPLTLAERLCRDVFLRHAGVGVTDMRDTLDSLRFYLRTTPDVNGEALYRPFHQGLVDVLRGDRRAQPELAAEVLYSFLASRRYGEAPRDWDTAEPYLFRHLPQHAIDADRPQEVLGDIEFLVHADIAAVVAAFATVESVEQEKAVEGDPALRLNRAILAASIESVWRSSPRRRRQMLAVNCARYGARDLLVRLQSGLGGRELHVAWATGNGVSPFMATVLPNVPGETRRIALGRTLDGASTVVSGGASGTLRFWAVETRTLVAEVPLAHAGPITAVECVVIDGVPTVVSAGVDGVVRTWDLGRGIPTLPPMGNYRTQVISLAVAETDSGPIAMACHGLGRIDLWDLRTGLSLGEPIHADRVRDPTNEIVVAITAADIAGSPVVVVSRTSGKVELWDIRSRSKLSRELRIPEGEGGVRPAVTLQPFKGSGGLAGLVAGTNDGEVRVCDLTNGNLIASFSAHRGAVTSLTVTLVDQEPCVVSSGSDGTLHVWSLTRREAITSRLSGHEGTVTSVCSNGRTPTVVSSGEDGTIRVWYLGRRNDVGTRTLAHRGSVSRVATARRSRAALGATAGFDGDIIFWDLEQGVPSHASTPAHRGGVSAMVDLQRRGHDFLVTAGRFGNLRLWDLRSARSIDPALPAYMREVDHLFAIESEQGDYLVCAQGVDVDVWDLAKWIDLAPPSTPGDFGDNSTILIVVDGRPVAVQGPWNSEALMGRVGSPRGMFSEFGAITALTGLLLAGQATAVTGDTHGGIGLWNLGEARAMGRRSVHGTTVRSLVCGVHNGGAIVVSGAEDGSIAVLDPVSLRTLVGSRQAHEGAVTALALVTVDADQALISGGDDGILRVWEVGGLEELDSFVMPAPIKAISTAGMGEILVVAGPDVVCLTVGTPPST